MLEELGLDYAVIPVDLIRGDQRTHEFLMLNPNGRIPVLVDHTREDFVLFESGAILWYLAERENRLLPSEPKERTLCHQWLMFQMSAVGPMMGQLNVFRRYFETQLPQAIDRYHNETERIFGVLNAQLANRDFILDKHSIADIAIWSWVYTHRWSGINLDNFPHLMRWKRALRKRPAYQRGIAVPNKIGRLVDGDGASAFSKAAREIVTT